MSFKKLRCILAPLIALCAMPVLWASPAEANFVSCEAQQSSTMPYGSGFTFSVECQYDFPNFSTDVAGEASTIGNTGIQSRLMYLAATSEAHAYAFGYTAGSSGPQQISGCVTDDVGTVAGTQNTSWATKTCGTSTMTVFWVSLVVTGT